MSASIKKRASSQLSYKEGKDFGEYRMGSIKIVEWGLRSRGYYSVWIMGHYQGKIVTAEEAKEKAELMAFDLFLKMTS